MKIILGTVQFGLNYGISNASGKTSPAEVEAILLTAKENGINALDTASSYGNSEEVLGEVLPRFPNFDVYSKIASQALTPSEVLESFKNSLIKLKKDSLAGVMFHNTQPLLGQGGDQLIKCLQNLKAEGLVQKIGFSAYTEEEIVEITGHFEVDLIQVPLNILDQRLVKSGLLKKLKEKGVEIHTRSVFLQGLLLMKNELIPAHLSGVKERLQRIDQFCQNLGCSRLQLLMAFIQSVDEVDRVVVGVTGHQELLEIINVSKTKISLPFEDFSLDDKSLIDPRKWLKHV